MMEALSKISGSSVLVVGIYLSKEDNNIEHIVRQFDTFYNQRHVIQKWIAIGDCSLSEDVKKVTGMVSQESLPKFVLLNKILTNEELGRYDFVIICDDDISLPPNFLETYLDLVIKYDFAFAQPARTHNSYIDHPFVEQLQGLQARRTRFVEIGPFFSVRKDLFSAIFPFDESSSMGWGYDFVWPCLMEKLGLRMGIIDATPVEHSMRKPVKLYGYDEARNSAEMYLARNPYLTKEKAFRILESYALEKR
jgi:hypothetical protein